MSNPINTGKDTAGKTVNAEKVKPQLPGRRTLAILLAIFSFLLYINTIGNGYVLDDLAVIKQNTYVAQGVSAIPKLLTTPYLKGFKRAADTAASNDLYRPASLVMFAAEHQLSDGSPWISHLVNILLFAGCVVLLFLFFDLLFDRKKTGIALIAALLFAAHPIHTEVVANIKSRDELLCFFFAFASLIVYANYVRSGKMFYLAIGALLYLLSLLSKETATSFLIIIPIVFFFYLDEQRKRTKHIVAISVASFMLYITMRYAVLSHYNAYHTRIIDLMENALVGAPSVSSKFATAILVMGHYIRLLFIPYPLCSDYAFNSIPFVNFGNLWVWATIIIYAGLLGISIKRFIKSPKDPFAFGVLFFLVTIALFSNFIFLVGAVMAERFLFFASAGFCLVIAFGIAEVLKSRDDDSIFSPGTKVVLYPVLVLFSFLTYKRNADWKDNYTLFAADVQKFPANARLWYDLGYEQSNTLLEQEPDMNEKARLLSESIAALQKAVSIYPNYAMAHNDLGKLFQRVKQCDSAEVHLKRSVALNSKDPVNKTDLGGLYFARQKYDQAVALCMQALQIEPQNTEILNNIALSYMEMKQPDSAFLYAQKAQSINPQNALANEIIIAIKNIPKVADSVGK